MKRAAQWPPLVAAALFASLATGCVASPTVVIVDKKTALEEQAAGSWKGLSSELDHAGISAQPVPYTRGELEAAGVPVGKGDEELAGEEATSDPEVIDQLLLRRCVGEKLDGSLDDTPATCTAPIEASRQSRLLERENRRRWQLWRFLAGGKSGKPITDVRTAWRKAHLGEVICGGQVEREGGGWEVKRC